MVILPFNDNIIFHNSLLANTSKPKVGSSKNSTLGLDNKLIAIDKRLLYPPDSVFAFLFKTSSR